MGILDDIKVLELTSGLSGAFCAKLLADQGADTIKVEPPGWGDPARHEPPFIDGVPHPDRGTLFLAFNTNKRGVTLDLEQAAGRDLFLRLVQHADVVVESHPPGVLEQLGLDYPAMREANPGLVLTSITYFGQTGPYRNYRGSDLVAQALGGYLYAVTGSADRPPMGTTLEQMEITAARDGAIAIMATLLQRQQSGEGRHIDVSTMEAAVSTPSALIQPYSFTGRNPRRGAGDGNVIDGMHLPTKDGEVTLTTSGTGGRPMEVWAELLEEPRLLDAKFATRPLRLENWRELYDLVAPALTRWTNLDLMRETMARGLVIGLVQSPKQVVNSPHLKERGYFVELDHPETGALKYPGPGFLIDGVNPMDGSRPAPRLGEHNAEILGGELGLSTEELGLLRASRVI
ncbi:MAG: CoA transferase [Dehalococcoidia bacterium]|jgi:crotonobetainyl-CoA:carnitine CoA-transferase CaiB-like acyl-CoA transferase|nr:CoA transferase [Dehalococcoidia bacterium]MDP7085058.1 CoA transferase [Dehalococcoidia bacterium]MDP7201990.1 CoA transferase [Dehalococcoidia bacterium]HJN85580.1 CoA transferase [Dehalococcoidia bacterium]